MNFEQYRSIDAINFSTLKSMRKSPKQFKYDLENGKSDSVGKSMGRATHTAVLEPEKFNDEYAVFDGKIRKGKAWDLFEKENKNKTILKRDEAESVLRIAREVRSNPVVKRLLSVGEPEKTLQWIDPGSGLKAKARLDFLAKDGDELIIVDLKGTSDIRAEHFRRDAGKNGYHQQLGFYRSGVETIYSKTPKCVIIAVEIKPPHDVAVFKLEEEALDAGFYDCEEMLEKVAMCKTNNYWPGCYDSIQDLVLRKWDTGLDQEESASELGLEFESDGSDS